MHIVTNMLNRLKLFSIILNDLRNLNIKQRLWGKNKILFKSRFGIRKINKVQFIVKDPLSIIIEDLTIGFLLFF